MSKTNSFLFSLFALMILSSFMIPTFAVQPTSVWDAGDGVGARTVTAEGLDLNPNLSPRYALDFSDSNFVVVSIMLGIISLILVIPHLILKKKKIPSRPYVVLIAAAIMLFIGIPNFIQGIMILFMILINEHLWTVEYLSATVPFMILGFVLTGGGVALLAKSKLIRNFIEEK